MNKEDLNKKLENTNLPEIRLPSHQHRLKMALLNSGYFRKVKMMNPIRLWTKRLVAVGFVLALILAVNFIVIQPKLQVTRAMEIALNDPQVQQLIREYRVEIKEVKLKDGKAYALLGLPEEKPVRHVLIGRPGDYPSQLLTISFNPETGELEFFVGHIVEIDLKGKKVENIESIKGNDFSLGPVSAQVRNRAIEIIKSNPNVQIPENAVAEVRPLPPQKFKLEIREGKARAVPSGEKEDRKVAVIYRSQDKKSITIFIVNLDKGEVEAQGGGGMTTQSGPLPKPQQLTSISGWTPTQSGPAVKLPESTAKEGEGGWGWTKDWTNNRGVEIAERLLREISEKDQRIKDLLRNNDYKILEVKAEPVITKTEFGNRTGYKVSIETITVVLEKISTKEKYLITIDVASKTVKSIEKKK